MKLIKWLSLLCLVFITGCLTTNPSPKPSPTPEPAPNPGPPPFPNLPASPVLKVIAHPMGVIMNANTAQIINTPATSVKYAWSEPSGGSTITGFKFYYGPSSLGYTNAVPVSGTNFTLNGLPPTSTVFATVTATGPGGESLPAPEVAYTVPILPPTPQSWAISITGTEYPESDGPYWQLNPSDPFSVYTNGNECSITWQSPNWNLAYTNGSVLYNSTNIVNTGWVPVNGTNFIVSVPIGNPQGAPQPPSIAANSLMIYWGMPSYNVSVSQDLNGQWMFLTNTPNPYIFINPQEGGTREFFKIDPVITNVISKTIQN